jgi:hypothetical protein
MFIKVRANQRSGYTLVEMFVAAGIFTMVGLAVTLLYTNTLRSFAALTNYGMLDRVNRQAMDKMTREIREAKSVVNYTTNNASSFSFINGDGATVTYTFSPSAKKLIRSLDTGFTETLLTNCDLLNFSLFIRTPVTNSLQPYAIATNNWATTVKVVQLTWRTSSSVLSAQVESENVQTARVVIRKQQDN